MTLIELLILTIFGLFAGVIAGFLGIGGGTILVPLLITLGYEPVEAVGTSSLSILITALSGSIQNWRMGYLTINQVLGIGFPALISAQLGVYLANLFPSHWLLFTFGLFLAINIYLVDLRKQITAQKKQEESPINNQIADNYIIFTYKIITGSLAGLLAGVFGVGGGVIMVPLQILLLGETIKAAIQTSLGVIVITAVSACIGQAIRGNVLLMPGFLLGFGGLLGVQFSTRFLPKLPEKVVSLAFRALLAILSIYIFWQAWQNYGNTISN